MAPARYSSLRLFAALPFFSARFSFSDLLGAVFDVVFFGDLSAMVWFLLRSRMTRPQRTRGVRECQVRQRRAARPHASFSARLVTSPRIHSVKTVAMRWLFRLLRSAAPLVLWRAESMIGSLPLPTDLPSVHASGGDSDRILLIGSGPAMGYGVLSHELALPGQLARQISAETGRGATVDVVASRDMSIHTVVDHLAEVNLARFDAVVLTVGINDALRLTAPRQWRRGVRALAEYVAEHLALRAQAFLIGIPPIRTIPAFSGVIGALPEWHRHTLNRDAEALCREFPLMTFVPFEARGEPGDRYRSAHTYSVWASLMLPQIVSVLQSVSRVDPVQWDEGDRQRALESLQILDTEPEERFDRIAEFARKLFATHSAVITFIDRDREWMKTGAGFDLVEAPRGSLLVDQVIQSPEAFIVEDATRDSRFAANPFVIGPPYLRFYAGHPIESHNGERVGVLCVFDARPRQFTELDARLLRDLAHMVQRELVNGDPE